MADRINEWIARYESDDSPLIPAATVVLLRDGAHGLETLLMRRNSSLSFAEGMWVFPGGRIDADDHPTTGLDVHAAARSAAVREAKEEADLDIDISSLVYFSHWIPPMQAPKRFSTWFFAAPAPGGTVTVDQGEITDHAWWRPTEALQHANEQRLEILPPTWMSLHDLATFTGVAEALTAIADRGPQRFATRIIRTPHGPAATWETDAAYESGAHDEPGPRHRLVMTEGAWRLECAPD